jgi:hypothetical protein
MAFRTSGVCWERTHLQGIADCNNIRGQAAKIAGLVIKATYNIPMSLKKWIRFDWFAEVPAQKTYQNH